MCECNQDCLNSFCHSFSNGNPASIVLLIIVLILIFPIAFPIFIYYTCCKKQESSDERNSRLNDDEVGNNQKSDSKTIQISENKNSSYNYKN